MVWDITDFSNITCDMVVTAVQTANEYRIEYNLGKLADDDYATIADREQTVKYGDTFTLCLPECYGYEFVKWVITGTNTEFVSGVWAKDDNVSLTAVWELDDDSNRWWSDNF